MTALAPVLQAFFTERLIAQRQVSGHTVAAYRDTFRLLLAFALMFPRRTVMLIFPPIPMPAWLFVTIYGVIELFQGVSGTQAGVAHFAHLGGMLGGWLMIRYGRGRR